MANHQILMANQQLTLPVSGMDLGGMTTVTTQT